MLDVLVLVLVLLVLDFSNDEWMDGWMDRCSLVMICGFNIYI